MIEQIWQVAYIFAALSIIGSIKWLSSPATARQGVMAGQVGMLFAVVGTLLINWAKTVFSEAFPELWLFGLGGLFIAVVLAFPRGLAGLVTDQIIPWVENVKKGKGWGNHQPSPTPAE